MCDEETLKNSEEIWQLHSSPAVYWAIFFTGLVATAATEAGSRPNKRKKSAMEEMSEVQGGGRSHVIEPTNMPQCCQ
jgi:hypothetical protein